MTLSPLQIIRSSFLSKLNLFRWRFLCLLENPFVRIINRPPSKNPGDGSYYQQTEHEFPNIFRSIKFFEILNRHDINSFNQPKNPSYFLGMLIAQRIKDSSIGQLPDGAR